MGNLLALAGYGLAPLILLGSYVWVNDRRIRTIPPSVATLGERATVENIRRVAEEMATRHGTEESPEAEMKRQTPPRTGRKYIVTGGAGFLGGWIVSTLLERGEDPKRIRVLDIAPKLINPRAEQARSYGLQYIKTDITNTKALEEAFSAPWDMSTSDVEGITVIHTVANIRFYERHPALLHRSVKVNVQGTQNIIDACKSAGADVLVFTSSGSLGLQSTSLFTWPWQSQPEKFVQVINDNETSHPKSHWEFFSNYAVTKKGAEDLVREADKTPLNNGKMLRTGVLRPGNAVFGPSGDLIFGAYLIMRSVPTWTATVAQSLCYVENCALAHLLYERRLLDLTEQDKSIEKPTLPDIGGQAFCVADPGPVRVNGDAYKTLEVLSNGDCHFTILPPTPMLILGTLFEVYHIFHFYATSTFPFLSNILPPLAGDIVQVQPSLFSVTSIHIIMDDSRARLPPSQGGLGYKGAWTSEQGLWKTWHAHANVPAASRGDNGPAQGTVRGSKIPGAKRAEVQITI